MGLAGGQARFILEAFHNCHSRESGNPGAFVSCWITRFRSDDN